MQSHNSIKVQRRDRLRIRLDRRSISNSTIHKFRIHRSSGRDQFPESESVRRHRLCVGKVVNQVTDYERLALFVIKCCVREAIAGEVARVVNRVSGRKDSDGEKESLRGLDVCSVAEGPGCTFTEHCITESEYYKGFKVRGSRTCVELETLALHC